MQVVVVVWCMWCSSKRSTTTNCRIGKEQQWRPQAHISLQVRSTTRELYRVEDYVLLYSDTATPYSVLYK